MIHQVFFLVHKKDVVLSFLTIQLRLMENLVYTGPRKFRKHTLTARKVCVFELQGLGWASELDYSISTHLWTGPHVLPLVCCQSALVLPVWSRICEMILCPFTHSHASGEAKGISAVTEWLTQSGREGFKAMLRGLEKVCLNGLSATGRDTSIKREIERRCSEECS